MTAYDGFYHYLPVNDQAMRWGIYLTGAGRGTIHPREHYPGRSHPSLYQFDWGRGRTLPEFQIVLITGGTGEFESEATGRRVVHDGSLIVLFPGVWHRYRPDPATGWTERWIGFSGEIAQRLLMLNLLEPARALAEVRSRRRAINVFDQLLRRIHRRPTQNSIRLSMHAMATVAQLLEDVAVGAGRGKNRKPIVDVERDPVVAQALEMIWTHSHRQLSVEHIAAQLPVTRRTLDRRFAASTGRSVLQEINLCRLSRARRLLTETELPIKTVAYLAGFSDPERMRVAFVEHEGCPPGDYRRQGSHVSNHGARAGS